MGSHRRQDLFPRDREIPADWRIVARHGGRIANLVFRFDVGEAIDIQEAAATLEGASYEPEIFGGVIFKRAGSLIVFKTGKGIVTGVRTVDGEELILAQFVDWMALGKREAYIELVTATHAFKASSI